MNLPIVQALSKKFFPAELNSELENDTDNQSLLRTIRISRNLFSLTERLPKSKYRGRSNDLQRNNSVDSHLGVRHALTHNGSAANLNNKLKQMGVNSQMDMNDSIEGTNSPGKLHRCGTLYSRKEVAFYFYPKVVSESRACVLLININLEQKKFLKSHLTLMKTYSLGSS